MTPKTEFEKITHHYMMYAPDALPEVTSEQKNWFINIVQQDNKISADDFLPERYNFNSSQNRSAYGASVC